MMSVRIVSEMMVGGRVIGDWWIDGRIKCRGKIGER